MLPVFCLLETASLYFGGTYKMTGMSLAGWGEKQWKLKESTRTIYLSWLQNWKWWSHPPSPTMKCWGFSKCVQKPDIILSLVGLIFQIVHLLKPPHSAGMRWKVEAARGEDGGRKQLSHTSLEVCLGLEIFIPRYLFWWSYKSPPYSEETCGTIHQWLN